MADDAGPGPGDVPPDDLEVLVDGGPAPEFAGLVEGAARAVLRAEGVAQGEVSVALLDDDAIRSMNREHLGHDWVTDVISFALWAQGEPVLGDIYIGVEQARRQALEAGVPVEEELARLAVHGSLHVLGWDHPEAGAARESSPMYRRQEEILREILPGVE